MKNSIKILMGLALLAIGSQAQALVITITPDNCEADPLCWSGIDPLNPDATDVSNIVTVDDLVKLYTAEVADPVVEEGAFSSSYDTIFSNETLDPSDALISYVVAGDSIICGDCFLLVKDGVAHDPIWYIFDIGYWDGTDSISLEGFWPDEGAISHISIFGNVANVPEPGMIGLLAIGLIGVVVARRKMKV